MLNMKTLIAATVAVAAMTLPAAAFAACSLQQEEAAGRKIAAAAKSELSNTVGRQSDRLIKIYECAVVDDVTYATFRYNFMSEERAYAVDGKAEISGGDVALDMGDADQVWASIDTYYRE